MQWCQYYNLLEYDFCEGYIGQVVSWLVGGMIKLITWGMIKLISGGMIKMTVFCAFEFFAL